MCQLLLCSQPLLEPSGDRVGDSYRDVAPVPHTGLLRCAAAHWAPHLQLLSSLCLMEQRLCWVLLSQGSWHRQAVFPILLGSLGLCTPVEATQETRTGMQLLSVVCVSWTCCGAGQPSGSESLWLCPARGRCPTSWGLPSHCHLCSPLQQSSPGSCFLMREQNGSAARRSLWVRAVTTLQCHNGPLSPRALARSLLSQRTTPGMSGTVESTQIWLEMAALPGLRP